MASNREVKRLKRSCPAVTSAEEETCNHRHVIQYADFLQRKYAVCRQKKEYCDVTVKVGDTVLECHRLVLGSNSSYFTASFKNHFQTEGNVITLPVEYVDEQSFLKLVDAMYGKPFVIKDDLIPLLTTSFYLELTYFVDRCKDYIRKNLGEKIDTIALFCLPQLQFDKSLYNLVKMYNCRNFPKLHKRLVEIPLDQFSDLFNDPDLFVTNQEQMFDFAKRWISHDMKNRRQHLKAVASLLKPFHTPAPEMVKVIDYFEVTASEAEIHFALNTLLEYPITPYRISHCRHELLSTPLFFAEPSDGSPMVFATHRNKGWEYWNEENQFRPPIASNLLDRKEGAVAEDSIYIAGKMKPTDDQSYNVKSDIFFHGLDVKTRQWTELCSPRRMPSCLVSMDSKIYAYDNFPVEDGYHVSVFESVMNRWFRIPAVIDRRKFAGITCSDHVLYVVGGVAATRINSSSPQGIIEFYDSRRGSWSRLGIVSQHTILNSKRYYKRVCCMDYTLYIADEHEGTLLCLDLRNQQITEWESKLRTPIQFLTRVDRSLWSVGIDSAGEIETVHVESKHKCDIQKINTALQPIAMPYYY